MSEDTEMDKKKKRRLKPEIKGILIFVLVLGVLTAAAVVYQYQTAFSFASGLAEPIVTIDETVVTLKEISYYIMEVENTGDEFARLYNPDNPIEYWGLYMNEAASAGYVSDLARTAALDYCIRDNIYSLEAVKNGVELTGEERESVRTDAEDYYGRMTQRQRETTQLATEDLELIFEKIALTQKYMVQLSSQEEDVSVLEAVTLHYDVGGDYYESLKDSYAVKVNERIWGQVRPGHTTIN